jgi:hypothetical protein
MRKFLESMGVLATKDYFPEDPDEGRVKAYEEHGLVGPNPSAPRICLNQTFKGKWNKEVVEILTTRFILAVKQGTYKPIQQTWLQIEEDNVRKKCQSKLYRTQRICMKPRKGPESDKINRMYQRRQEVRVLSFTPCRLLTSSTRRTTEEGRSTTQTITGTQKYGPMSGYYLTLSALWVLVTMRPTMIRNTETPTHASRVSGVLI